MEEEDILLPPPPPKRKPQPIVDDTLLPPPPKKKPTPLQPTPVTPTPSQGAVATPLTDFLRSGYSTLVDVTPKSIAQGAEVLKSHLQPTNISEYIKKDKYAQFQDYVREKDPEFKGFWSFLTPFDEDKFIPKYGKEFLESKGLGEKITKMEENLPKVIERRKELEAYVQQQNKEAAEKTVGIVQDFKDIKNGADFASYIGGLAGQTAAQIPMAVATRGASSYVQEAAAIYDKQLDRLAKENKISREEVIERNLDSPAVGQTYALLAAGLDASSAGNIIGAFRKGGGNLLKKWVTNAVPEGITEAAQGTLEDIGAGGTLQDALTGEGLNTRLNELVGGAIGGTIFSFNGKSQQKAIVDQAINEIGDTGDASINSTIDAEAALTPEEEELIKTNQAKTQLEEITEKETKLQKDAESLRSDEGQVRLPGIESEESQNQSSEDLQQQAQEKPGIKEEQIKREAQIEEATKKVSELTKLLADPATTPEQEQEYYRQLAETKQSLRQIAPPAKSTKAKTAIQKQIEDVTGVTKPEKSVKMTPSEAIKHQVQTFYKGVKEGQKLTNEQLVSRVQEAIKDAPLQPKQINSILGRVKKTKLYTPESMNRLNDYIDKVSNDAEYADKIDESKSINKRLRKLSKISAPGLQNYKSVARIFASINPEDTFINKHLDFARKILSGLTPTSNKGYGSLNVEEARDYIEDLQGKIAEYQEDLSVKEQATTKEKRNLQTFTSLKSSVDALNQKDLSEFDESEQRTIETLKSLDPATLTDEQASTAVKVIDNIIENDDFSNIGAIEPIIESKKNLKELKESLEGKELKEIKGVGKVAANIYQQIGRVAGDPTLASKIQQKTGITELANAGSRVENQEIRLTRDLEKKIIEIRKKYKTNVMTPENQIRLVIFSELAKNYGDDAHIEKVKDNIEQTIDEYEKSDPDEAAVWRDAYKGRLSTLEKADYSEVQTVEDAENIIKETPGLYELWKFFNERSKKDINPRLAKTATEIHNKAYLEADNYAHTGLKDLNAAASQLDLTEKRVHRKTKGVKPVQSKTAITATRNINKGWGYSSDWIGSQLRGYRESLYDIEASKPAALVEESLSSPEFEEVVGGKENADIIRNMVNKAGEIQKGTSRATANDAVKFLNSATAFLRNVGSARALGSVAQLVKQIPSVWTKGIFNHLGTNSLPEFFKAIGAVNLRGPSEGLKKLFDQSTIGVRGERLGGIERGDSISLRLTPRAKQLGAKVGEFLHKKSDQFNRRSLKVLTNSDLYAARTTWLSYYLQSLKDQGITDVDLNEEYLKSEDPKRKQASAFAEHMIADTQVPSNPAFLSQLSRNENDAPWNFVKNVLLPFSTFSINAKYRQIGNIGSLIRTPNQRTASAVAGDFAENIAFASIAWALSAYYKPLIKQAVEALVDVEPPEEDEDKSSMGRNKAFRSSIVNSVVPFSVGTLGESGTAFLANQIARIAQNPEMSYEEWKKETGGFVYEPDKVDYGLFSIGVEPPVEAAKGTRDVVKSALGEPITFESYGHVREADLTPSQQKLLALKTMLDMAGIIGISEADVYNQVKKAYKEQLNEASKPAQSSPKFKHSRRILRRAQRRVLQKP